MVSVAFMARWCARGRPLWEAQAAEVAHLRLGLWLTLLLAKDLQRLLLHVAQLADLAEVLDFGH